MKYLYRGTYENNKRTKLISIGFTEQDLNIGSCIFHKNKLFRILVKETYTNDCTDILPIKIEKL